MTGTGPLSRPPDGYRFSQRFTLAPVDGSPLWETTAAIFFEVGGKGSGAWVEVPAGFRFDGASIPRLARIVFDRGDARLMRAACIHDWLLSLPDFSRTVAALAFRDALVAGRVPAWQIAIMVSAVWLWTVPLRRVLRR